MLFVLASASISIESIGPALTAFVACNNLVIESTKNLPTTSLSDIEAISLIAGWFDQESRISYLLSSNIMDIQIYNQQKKQLKNFHNKNQSFNPYTGDFLVVKSYGHPSKGKDIAKLGIWETYNELTTLPRKGSLHTNFTPKRKSKQF
jgi:hypothetical protein